MKKKIFLMLAVMSMLICVFAVSVSAAHDVTRKVTLDNGTEVALYDENGYALTYYLNEANELVSSRTINVITVNGSGVATYNGINAMSVVVANFQGQEVEDLVVKQVPSYYYGNYGGGYHSYNNTVEYIYLPDTLTTTATNQFRCTSKLKIVDVTRNSNWETMGQYCFYYATGLTEFYYPPKVKTTPGSGNDGANGKASTFSHCTSLKSLYFYDNSVVETFGDACFTSCTALETVVLPNSITALPGSVFSSCTSLKEITIPNSVKTIKNHAFAWCTSLEVIRMGASFEYFNNTGDNSFTYTTGKVKEIYIPKTFYQTAPDTSLGYQVSYAFHGLAADCKIFYCGTVKDFAKAKENFLTQKSASSNNGAFLNATVITYADYLANPDNYANGRYIVCGYDTCEAFYGGHQMSESATMQFNGYMNDITFGSTCKNCTYTGIDSSKTIGAIFNYLGFSYTESALGGTYSMAQFFGVNKANLAKYEEAKGTTLTFGVIAMANVPEEGAELKAISPSLDDSISMDFTSGKNNYFEIKILGIDKSDLETKIVFCAYVIENGKMFYLNNGETVEELTGESYSDVVAIKKAEQGGNV